MSANCYLVRDQQRFVLVDTARPPALARIEATMASAGCSRDDLALIVLTHGDFDHTGNAARLRKDYHAPIAMHRADSPMVERGDMFASRHAPNRLMRGAVNALFGIARFAPDVFLADGDTLSTYGLDARVISLPGHSPGSIGILTADGQFFCGDAFENTARPRPGTIIDDPAQAQSSIARVRALPVDMIYPGHGKPFKMSEIAWQ